jgi:hypothetical protein
VCKCLEVQPLVSRSELTSYLRAAFEPLQARVQVTMDQQSASLTTMSSQLLAAVKRSEEARFECVRLADKCALLEQGQAALLKTQREATEAAPLPAQVPTIDVDAIAAKAARLAQEATEKALTAMFESRVAALNDRMLDREAAATAARNAERSQLEQRLNAVQDRLQSVQQFESSVCL